MLLRSHKTVIVGLLCLAGCRVGPKYQRPMVPAPEGFRGVPVDAGTAPVASFGEQKWWDVFQDPQRFRFNSVGQHIRKRYGADLVHKFVDAIDAKAPLDYFTSQSSATIEDGAPTYYRSTRRGAGYHRLLLPMWGNGRIEMMLGAVMSVTRT